MNVFAEFRDLVLQVIAGLQSDAFLPDDLNVRGVTVEPPRDPSHGDMATNAAMVLSKQAKMKPRDLAEKLTEKLAGFPSIEAAEIAGPGFINLRLAKGFWQGQLGEVLVRGLDYGSTEIGEGIKVNVEYVSANPTGPMHVGHCRGAVFGDALASLLEKVGYSVSREYYINDAGSQIGVLAESAYLRYREALGEDIGDIPEGLYPGDYLKEVGEALARQYGDDLRNHTDRENIVRDTAVDMMMDMIRNDLAALGIRHETFFSEKKLHEDGRIDDVVAELTGRDLIYEGVLEPPKGVKPDDWEERPQTLFRATQFGDDVDRALKKSNGDYTYFAADIAYHYDKFLRGFTQQIDILGADHGGYVKRMKAAVKAISQERAALDCRLCQLVHLYKNGEPYKMSKRAGTFVTLRDVVDEVGKDVVRFIMLTRKNDAPLDFDFDKVTEQSKDNPVFYVQYAHARINSVFRKAKEEMNLEPKLEDLKAADLSVLASEEELSLIKLATQYPRMIEAAAEAHEPHRIAFYLYDLASAFHSFWNRGNEDPSLRFVLADQPNVTLARLAMIRAIQTIIASGLTVLGVDPVEEMR